MRESNGTQGGMETCLENCKSAISFFDQIEEKQTLHKTEFGLRQLIRQKAYQLATLIEIKWSQRSHCRWLKEGDNNTRYFHSNASARMRRNMVISSQHEGTLITGESPIKDAFFSSHEELDRYS